MKTLGLFLMYVVLSGSLYAQGLLDQAKGDFNTYLRYYAEPLFEANLVNFSDGWSHGAKTLKPWRAKADIMVNYTFFPPEKENFTFTPSEYEILTVIDAQGNEINTPVDLPTFAGGSSSYRLQVKVPSGTPGTYEQIIFDAPPGIKEKWNELKTPLPPGFPGIMFQLRMGLPLDFEAGLRFIPTITMNDFQLGMLGGSLKHEFGHYFLPDTTKIHLAVVGGFTSGHVSSAVPDLEDFEGIFKLLSYNAQLFASYDMKFLTFYGSIGATKGNSTFQILGETAYEYDIVDESGNKWYTVTATIKDPVDLRYDMSMTKASVGMLLNLKFLHIFVQYNMQQYPGVHAGLSITY